MEEKVDAREYLEKREFRYYIFCEGQQTEPFYFEGFKRYIEENPIYRDMVLIEIEPCQAETMRVIGMAERYVKRTKSRRDRSGVYMTKTVFLREISMESNSGQGN